MPNTLHFSFPRSASPFSALRACGRMLLLGVSALAFVVPTHAQWQAGTWPALAAQSTSELQLPSGSAVGVSASNPTLPTLPQRPDLGAQDAARAVAAPASASKPDAPSQFQRFVQEGTGRLLPVFGANLFDQAQAYAPIVGAPTPDDYVIGPGDEVRLNLSGAIDHATTQTVDRQGRITLPKVGAIELGGVAFKDLESTLRRHIGTVFTNFSVSASLGKLRGVTVYVVGQARHPGSYSLSSLSTLVNAVFASGGPAANGSMRHIALKRGGKTVTTLDLYDFIARGDKGQDALLQSGDVIVIAPAGPRVALFGATDHAAIYEIKEGNTLEDVLALGGGVPTLATPQKALIERIQAQQPHASRVVQHLSLDAKGLAQRLHDGDVVTLLPISPAFANAVTLQGAVAQPLRHAFVPGMRVQDLIPDREALISPDYFRRKNQLVQNQSASWRAQGLTPAQIQALEKAQLEPTDPSLSAQAIAQASPEVAKNTAGASVTERVRGLVQQINWDYAVIERLNPAELRTELIPFNLGKAILHKDPQHNLALQPGDVITIMSSADIELPVERKTRLVRLEGEVASPGVYQALPGETLAQLIARTGGLSAQAYLFGTEFTRESVRRQQQQNLDQLVRRLESQLQSAGATLVANLSPDRAQAAQTLQQQQQQQMQAQIHRLKSLRSKGRVALELDPAARQLSALPEVPLEDGDAILVPAVPAFVSALGSVNNDNVMIYKPGKTVGDVLRAAGLAEDAEPTEAFVLRADGSVFSRRSAGWFNRFEAAAMQPGDTLVVPPKVDRESGYNFVVRALRDWTQIFSNLGIGAAAIRTLRN